MIQCISNAPFQASTWSAHIQAPSSTLSAPSSLPSASSTPSSSVTPLSRRRRWHGTRRNCCPSTGRRWPSWRRPGSSTTWTAWCVHGFLTELMVTSLLASWRKKPGLLLLLWPGFLIGWKATSHSPSRHDGEKISAVTSTLDDVGLG